MAFSVALKIQTFIADAYVPGVPTPTSQAWYGGDNRGFSSSDTVRFRTKQYLTFNFDNNGASWNGFTDTGETHRYTINTKTGYQFDQTDKQSPTTIRHSLVTAGSKMTGAADDRIQIRCICDSQNPFEPFAPAINYTYMVTVYKKGTVNISGTHDGFPCYESYARLNSGSWQALHRRKNMI
ncbi:DUF3238 domain-containing protein [Saccharibacillus brassicae]|uniref:DUF3238 domain-containing protein n=1 Tax=Saccharibacillus brassicae TaxID=2583377 RepID=A0A4Y6UWL2_SACBS|nr:DUF3238 domain-containing protein [Saccharibacillus brassicae]QDH21504.1 DUF3238 domain-containing protein [Saccharibacillus brassicae]